MEAPEKIYIPTAGGEMHYHMACSNNEFKESIEYIRADTFMEKAVEWLKENADMFEAFDPNSRTYYMDKDLMVEDFKKAMKL